MTSPFSKSSNDFSHHNHHHPTDTTTCCWSCYITSSLIITKLRLELVRRTHNTQQAFLKVKSLPLSLSPSELSSSSLSLSSLSLLSSSPAQHLTSVPQDKRLIRTIPHGYKLMPGPAAHPSLSSNISISGLTNICFSGLINICISWLTNIYISKLFKATSLLMRTRFQSSR